MYPMVLDMKHADDLGYQLKQMKEDIRHVPNKGVGYGILRYLTAPEA
jgi:surfactin family lipopeptide synthetase A